MVFSSSSVGLFSKFLMSSAALSNFCDQTKQRFTLLIVFFSVGTKTRWIWVTYGLEVGVTHGDRDERWNVTYCTCVLLTRNHRHKTAATLTLATTFKLQKNGSSQHTLFNTTIQLRTSGTACRRSGVQRYREVVGTDYTKKNITLGPI